MRKADTFEVRTARRDPEPSILLARPGEKTAISLDAVALLEQYQFSGDDVLLVLDEDSPFEEQLHLVLLRGIRIIDHIVISAPYASGI